MSVPLYAPDVRKRRQGVSESGGSDGSDGSDGCVESALKPIVNCRPDRPRGAPGVMCRVKRTALMFGCSELDAACVVIQILHEALEVYGLAHPLPQPS